ncbi:uncharacterized protein MELLADRAFT_55946 [Melampsora larici-populina 98AG31]|uniref:VanZ-like domain-containing protein n=1 Tax=Melampsora larici-populina (strain 98AG31 / pathotype 3-4-7) TaxID=747676 RepID=F4RK59_MELLP|nr:uncharacterized protein MELLADRAFT_55946 [Melampsora larici-populina 98AG31]EGG07041.1 hypothetical protein MELLADRAFT_55946 [Melampsora larici-populina 98AG31]
MKSYRLSNLLNLLNLNQNQISLPQERRLPIRIRPVFLLLTLFTIIILTLVGFNPALNAWVLFPKKLFHFISFTIVTGLFYSILDVDQSSQLIWYWKHFNSICTTTICFLLGGIGSELIQVFLPWKVFSWGDLLANEAGCLVGYHLSRSLHKQYQHKRELASLYQPLVNESGMLDEDEEEDEEDPGDLAKSGFGSHPGLGNVWSDNLDESHEYFRFEDDDDDRH